MHRWSNLILCLYNVETLNICMKEFDSENILLNICMKEFGLEKIIFDKVMAAKKIDKMTAVRT